MCFFCFFFLLLHIFLSYANQHYFTSSHEMEGGRKKKAGTAPITHPVLSLHTVVVVDCHVAIVTDTDPLWCHWPNFNPPRPFLTPHHCYLSSIQSYALIQTGFSYYHFFLLLLLFCLVLCSCSQQKPHTAQGKLPTVDQVNRYVEIVRFFFSPNANHQNCFN